jgi:Zn-finger nucleic acid-binding protein
MICPNCPGNVEMVKIDEDHSQCPICNGQWWEPDKPERGEYKKKEEIAITDPTLMLWHKEDMNYKPPLPPGVPHFKGGSKSGKRRKKPAKRDIRVVYET